mgnify:CR=1
MTGGWDDEPPRRRIEFWPREYRGLAYGRAERWSIGLGAVVAVALVVIWLTGLVEPLSISIVG